MTSPATTPAVFDLDALKYAETIDHNVRHPVTGAETGWIITFTGPAHPQTLAADEAEFRKSQEELERRQEEAAEAVKAGKPAPKIRTTTQELREQTIRRVASRVLGSTVVRLGGKEIALTPENAAQVLADPAIDWLPTDLDAMLKRRSSFLPSVKQTS